MREITRELHNAEAEMAVRCINGEGCTAGRVRQYPRKVLHYLEGYWLWCMPQRMVDARNWFHDGLIGNSELYMYTYIHVYKNNLYWTPVSVCILSLLRYLAPQALNMELQGAVPWMLLQPSHPPRPSKRKSQLMKSSIYKQMRIYVYIYIYVYVHIHIHVK